MNAEESTRVACGEIEYEVQENDTLSSISANYAVGIAVLKEYNGLVSDTVRSGQKINIPLCQRLATAGPSPTPTPPPPYAAPSLLLPPDGAPFTGADEVVALQWASVGSLRENEAYAVSIMDVTGGEERKMVEYVFDTKFSDLWMSWDDWKKSGWPIVRGTFIGFFLGLIPGVGAVVPTFISYVTEKKMSKYPEKFGTGMIEGVAAPETANNAYANAAMIPLFTLGIPGSPTIAILSSTWPTPSATAGAGSWPNMPTSRRARCCAPAAPACPANSSATASACAWTSWTTRDGSWLRRPGRRRGSGRPSPPCRK
jgi:hypothetical protein